jgi:hypothetical protein
LYTRSQIVSVCALLALAGLVAGLAWRSAFQEVAWPDECIYLVGARNIVERGTLDTNYYLTHSILLRGHPHRDVHLPGFIFALAPFVRAFGTTLAAGVVLNVLAFLASTVLVYAIARRVLQDDAQALTAAALFTLLPPFPGYLAIVYPEHAVALALLAGLACLVRGGGTGHAALAGAIFAAGALLRESLVLAAPFFLAWIPRKALLRGFLPAALATLLIVVFPFARERAIHPNALYVGALEEARRSDAPVATLVGTLLGNVETNLALLARADPLSNPEDTTLLFIVLLVLAAAAGVRNMPPQGRRLAVGAFTSFALLTLAILPLYVIRERGGVWGGVRACMALLPVFLVLATPLLFRSARRSVRVALILATAALFGSLDAGQIRFFNRYKGSDHEDQDRHARTIARYVDAHRPRRIVARSFLYGLTHYPVEVVWGLPKDHAELVALEQAIPYDFMVIHWKSPLRLFFVRNPRYQRVNRDDRDAEMLIWRRLY